MNTERNQTIKSSINDFMHTEDDSVSEFHDEGEEDDEVDGDNEQMFNHRRQADEFQRI